jgi:hypothetical protein
MREPLPPETLETLVCELDRRPKDAPTIDDIISRVTSWHREAEKLVVTFDPGAADLAAAVVKAERECCSTIGWHLEASQGVRLSLSGTNSQLDALTEIFSAAPPA